MCPYRYHMNLESEIQHSQASVPIAPLQRALLALSTQSRDFPSSRVIPISRPEILHPSRYLLPSEAVFFIDTFIGRTILLRESRGPVRPVYCHICKAQDSAQHAAESMRSLA